MQTDGTVELPRLELARTRRRGRDKLGLVGLVFGSVPTLGALAYVVVDLAGLYETYVAYQLYSARTGPRTRERETA